MKWNGMERGALARMVHSLRSSYRYSKETGEITGPSGSTVGWEHRGYIRVQTPYGQMVAHRLVYLLVTGEDPAGVVDHVNGNKADNRWVNLRVCQPVNNSRNAKTRADNTSGVKGVSYISRDKKWRGSVRTSSGRLTAHFGTLQGAEEWVKAAREGHHMEFHNHG